LLYGNATGNINTLSPAAIGNVLVSNGTNPTYTTALTGLTQLTSSGTIDFTGLGIGIVHSSSNGTLSSSAVNLANSDVTGVLPLANGGSNANLTAVSGGIIYSTTTGLAISIPGTNGYCLVSGAAGAPSWTQCITGTAATNYWQEVAAKGAVAPTIDNYDLLIGGQSTASAKFAFINTLVGTPTASVSAGVTGATYLTANGTLATTANQNLVLGGNGTTGNIVLTPLNTVTVNGAAVINGAQTVNGNLTATGTIDFSNLGIGVVHAGSGGVLSSSAVNLANSDVTGVLPVTHGGTGLSTITSGALLYGNATGNINTLSPAAIGNVLVSNGTNPTYTTALTALTQLTSSGTIQFSSLGQGIVHTDTNGTLTSSAVNLASSDVTGILPLANGGTNANLTAINGGVAYSTGTALAISTAGSNGYCLVSTGTGAPTWKQCATGPQAGVNYWQLLNGALSPINS
ncbi:MAG: hypothetical protein KGI11_09815, partial [Thaumarchaeota archaeon]|nr:hypothetical protein [Nitrososphaerota archaeon]